MNVYEIYYGIMEGAMKELSLNSTDETLETIKQFNDITNQMEYIIPNNGDIIYNIKSEDFLHKYRVLSPMEFEMYDGGVCWDYVIYQANWFKKNKPKIKYKTFYFEIVDDNNNPTHTFMLFYYKDKVYWFESSWKDHVGIFEFLNENQALTYITSLLIDAHPKEIEIRDQFITLFNPLDKKLLGLKCADYMEFMISRKEYKFKREKVSYIQKINDTSYMNRLHELYR